MAELKKYLQGSTLVETLVSMILIVIILGASFTALTGIVHSTLNLVRFRASFVVREMLTEEHPVKNPDTVSIDFGGFLVEEDLLPFDDSEKLRILVVNAITPDGKIIFSGRRVVKSDDD